MLIRVLPLVAGIVPVVGVTLAFWLGVRAADLPGCNPYLEGCTSISATGRYLPGALAFRASLFPQAVLLMFLWWFAAAWLRAGDRPRYASAMLVSGLIGGLALILYLTFLGTRTEFYQVMKQFGIYFYFLGTVVAQTLFTLAIAPGWIRKLMLALAFTPWLLGVGNFVQKALLSSPNHVENRIEWIVALAMQMWFVLLFLLWRRVGIRVKISLP